MTPPTAPMPTMTTSVFSIAMVRALPSCPLGVGPGLQPGDGHAGKRLFARKVGARVEELCAREADELPAGEVLVAAVDRVGEHAFHGMGAQSVEERLRGRECELARLALFQRADHFVLLGGAELHERLVVGFAAISVELGEAAPVE